MKYLILLLALNACAAKNAATEVAKAAEKSTAEEACNYAEVSKAYNDDLRDLRHGVEEFKGKTKGEVHFAASLYKAYNHCYETLESVDKDSWDKEDDAFIGNCIHKTLEELGEI